MFNHFSDTTHRPASNHASRVISDGPVFGFQDLPRIREIRLLLVSHMVDFEKDGGNATFRSTTAPSAFYLAPREKEVLLWAARGKSAWETAQLLGLSESTVKSYIKNACTRLQVGNKTHAVAICLSNGVFQI